MLGRSGTGAHSTSRSMRLAKALRRRKRLAGRTTSMSEFDIPYLWYPRGRNAWYPTYRRNGLLRALKSPDGERIKVTDRRIVEQGHPSILAAWLSIHESFEAETSEARDEKPRNWVYNR